MFIFSIVASVILLALCQLMRYWASTVLFASGMNSLIPGVIDLRYFENTGAAFSIFQNNQIFLIVLTGIALLAVAFILFVRRPKDKLETVALILIFSGGISNLIERISAGYVVDYFNLLFMRFAVFNLADCCICIGVGLLFIAFIRMEIRERREKKLALATEGEKQEGADGED